MLPPPCGRHQSRCQSNVSFLLPLLLLRRPRFYNLLFSLLLFWGGFYDSRKKEEKFVVNRLS